MSALYPALPSSLARPAWLRLVLASLFAGLTLQAAERAPEGVIFDLPADTLDRSAKLFAAQSGLAILLPGDAISDVRTKPVRGKMQPLAALEAMLANSGLRIVREPKSGAFAIRREPTHPNAPGATPAASARPDLPPDISIPMNTRKNPLALFAAWLGLSATAASTHAQTVPPAADNRSANEAQTIELSPFNVSSNSDVGYVAVNALAGGRTDAPLKLTPSSVSAMTTEFIQDLAIGDLREALPWTLNAEPGNAEINTGSQGGQLTNFRATGGAGNYPSRNYFVYYGVADSYNTERFEFARGPNAVLFGEAQLGGVATTFTKIPRLQQNFYRSQVRYTYPSTGRGSLRGTIDVNQPVGGRFALRINALAEDGASWRDFSDQSNKAITVSGLLKLTERTQLRAETDTGKKEFNLFATNYTDSASYWDGNYRYTGANALTAAAATAAGVSRITGTRYVWIPGVPQAGYSNWVNSYTSAGTGLGMLADNSRMLPRFPTLPSARFTLAPTDAYSEHRDKSVSVFLDHRFSDALQAQLATYYYDLDISTRHNVTLGNYAIDLNEFLPNGQRNPKVGVPFSEVRPSILAPRSILHETRALVTYKFERPRLFSLQQRFTLIAGRRSENYQTTTRFLQQVAGPDQNPNFNAAAMQVFYRYYWDEPLQFGMGELPRDSNRAFDYILGTQPGNLIKSLKDLDYAQVSSLTTLLDNRVSLVLGVRHDRLDMRRQGPVANVNVNNNIPQLGFNDVVGGWEKIKRKVTSPSLGGVAFVTPWLGVFGNVSENFNPPTNGAPDVDGNSLQGPRGSGADYGLKLSLLEGQVYATLTRYESRQTDRIVAIQPEITRLQQIWTNVRSTNLDQTTVDFRDTESIDASGYEAEIVANPTRRLRLSAGIAFPDTEIVQRLPGLRRYFDANLPAWNAALSANQVDDATALINNINAVRQTVESSTEGTRLDRTPDYRWNVYSSYTFTGGDLKGLSFGGGFNGRGPIKIGTRDARILFNTAAPTNEQRRAAGFAEIKAPATYTAAVRLAYRFRLGRAAANVQLNVNNVFDVDDPEWRSTSTYTAPGGVLTQAYSTFTRPAPRTFILTTSFDL